MTKLVRLLGLSLMLLIGCGHGSAPMPAATTANTPVEVAVETPVQQAIQYTVEQPGRIDPFEQTPIYTKIAGYVRTVHVEIGDRVKKGDLLVELDVPELVEAHRAKQALVVQAQLGIAQAEEAVHVIEASLATAQAEIDVAAAAQEKSVAVYRRWQLEYQRMERLLKEKVVDAQSRDEVQNQFRAAEAAQKEADARARSANASLDEARARLAKSKADQKAACNHLTVAEADERQSHAMVEYSRLTAPFDGIISDRQVHTGHFLTASTGSTTGAPLVVIVRTDKVRVFVEVPEADAIRVSDGNPAIVRVQTLNDRDFEGTVSGISWSLNPTQRTLKTEIDLPNPDGILRPGMYVHALISIQHDKAWTIPASAILVRDGVTFCYEVRDGKTWRLPLKLGLNAEKSIEIAKIQAPPRKPGDRPAWVDPTGAEVIVVVRPGELIENQEVHTTSVSHHE
jgi:multidrug efflux pump subunit AcrA (membrane-fusion protein)